MNNFFRKIINKVYSIKTNAKRKCDEEGWKEEIARLRANFRKNSQDVEKRRKMTKERIKKLEKRREESVRWRENSNSEENRAK